MLPIRVQIVTVFDTGCTQIVGWHDLRPELGGEA